MMLKQVVSAGVFVIGACVAISGCGSSDDSAASGGAGGTGGGSHGKAGASAGGRTGVAEGGAAGEDGAPTAGGAAGEGGAAGAPALHPPPSIDSKLCGDSSATPEACINCCYAGGFLTSTIYDDKCVCGTPSENPDVCGSKPATDCFSCCNSAGYASATFTFGQPTECSCTNKVDQSVCAASVKAPDPGSACHVCCLNDGYLHADYSGTDTPSCTCSS